MASSPPKAFVLLIALSLIIALWAGLKEVFTPAETHRLAQFHRLPLDPLAQMPDFSHISHIPWRKEAFFDALLPLVVEENHRLAWQRELVLTLQTLSPEERETLSAQDQQLVAQLLQEYRLEWPNTALQWSRLLKRVDQIPMELVLMQAANESAWGTSRFAQEGNNLFGEWCFSVGCGLVPERRQAGQRHEVRRFPSVQASIQSYMRNLNSHRAYSQLRQIRAQRRAAGVEVSAQDLLPGLLSYSERGPAYIRELNAMLLVNQPLIDEALQRYQALLEEESTL